ncbi:MAG: pentapeptide repeat-containing protein, partial [Mesorhizobium sp.]
MPPVAGSAGLSQIACSLDGFLQSRAAVERLRSKAICADCGLSGASMTGSYLPGAILTNANLTGVDLKEANMNGANLSRANLCGAELFGASLN